MNGLVEFEGRGQLPAAMTYVAADQPPDLIVVRNLITDTDLLRSLEGDKENFDTDEEKARLINALYDAVPEFHIADRVVADRWKKVAYSDMPIIHPVSLDSYVDVALQEHVDFPQDEYSVEAIAMASICIEGRRKFSAKKIPIEYKDESGNYDYIKHKYLELSKLGLEKAKKIRDTAYARADVNAGDMVLFPHHPHVTLHGVESFPGVTSTARLLTWLAFKPRS